MVRWIRWHCPPDTWFEIRALEVWARYLSVTEAPHNIESLRVSEEETFWMPKRGSSLNPYSAGIDFSLQTSDSDDNVQCWEGRSMIFLLKSCTRRDSIPRGKQWHLTKLRALAIAPRPFLTNRISYLIFWIIITLPSLNLPLSSSSILDLLWTKMTWRGWQIKRSYCYC